jgi:aconitate hydratase
VIAESFDEAHRCNLIGAGILPLQFIDGQNAGVLGLNGRETYTIELDNAMSLNQRVKVKVSTHKCVVRKAKGNCLFCWVGTIYFASR